jgi:D-amino-acid dehydrogenase
MAAGTGRLLVDWMSGRQTEIDTEGLTVARYDRSETIPTQRPLAA